MPRAFAIAVFAAASLWFASSDCAVASAGGEDERAAAWLERAASCFRTKETADAEIHLDVIHPFGVDAPARRGTVALRKGGSVRLEIGEPNGFLVVADGRTVRSWRSSDDLFVEEPYAGSALAAAFAIGFFEDPAIRTFSTRWLAGSKSPDEGGAAALEIAIGSSASLSARAVIGLAAECPCLRKIVVEDRAGCALRMEIDNVRFGVPLPARLFSFDRPHRAASVRP